MTVRPVGRITSVSRGPCTFRQQDVTRAFRAAFAAGAQKAQVEIGGIIITAERGSEGTASVAASNEWDAPFSQEETQ
jgi:hypothetical protein